VRAISAFETDCSPDLRPFTPIRVRISPRVRPSGCCWTTTRTAWRFSPLRALGAAVRDHSYHWGGEPPLLEFAKHGNGLICEGFGANSSIDFRVRKRLVWFSARDRDETHRLGRAQSTRKDEVCIVSMLQAETPPLNVIRRLAGPRIR
jgi:hypothetical protein